MDGLDPVQTHEPFPDAPVGVRGQVEELPIHVALHTFDECGGVRCSCVVPAEGVYRGNEVAVIAPAAAV